MSAAALAKDRTLAKDGFVKNYKSEARSVVIEKDDKSSMIDMALKSSYKMMVGAGESVRVAEIRLNDWTGKEDLFDELGFVDRADFEKRANDIDREALELKWLN